MNFLSLINNLNNDEDIDGILLQLPLPKHLNPYDFLDKIDPKKDVDGFHPVNAGKLLLNENPYAVPCTPKGIIRLLDEYKIQIEGKKRCYNRAFKHCRQASFNASFE